MSKHLHSIDSITNLSIFARMDQWKAFRVNIIIKSTNQHCRPCHQYQRHAWNMQVNSLEMIQLYGMNTSQTILYHFPDNFSSPKSCCWVDHCVFMCHNQTTSISGHKSSMTLNWCHCRRHPTISEIQLAQLLFQFRQLCHLNLVNDSSEACIKYDCNHTQWSQI